MKINYNDIDPANIKQEEVPSRMIDSEYHWGIIYPEYEEIHIANFTNDIIQASYDGEQDHFFIQPNEFVMPIKSEFIRYPYIFIKRRNKDKELEGYVNITTIYK